MNYKKINPTQVEELKKSIRGTIIGPGDADYEEAREVFYSWMAKHPAAIVKVTDAQDVVSVVNYARDNKLELAVRCGGHSNAGYGSVEGGLLLDVSGLDGLDIDVSGQTAWAGAGLTAGQVTKAAAAHGLVIGFGDTGSVGIGGLTLGGGVGFLVRKFGLTIDNLLSAEIVTADGEVRQVDAQQSPDLFWAIRGGGGNYGVVTRFKFQLHSVPQILGGMLILPANAANIAAYMQASEAAPDELSSIANVMPAPPMPMIPAEAHGKPIIFAMLCYAGDVAEGEKALAPFRAIDKPLADMLHPMPYAEMFPDEEGPHPVAAASYTMFVDKIGEQEGEFILERMAASKAQMAVAQLRPLGGAMARVPADATAFAHRASPIMVNVACLYENLEEADLHQKWVQDTVAGLQQSDRGAYVNFLNDEGAARVQAAYPGKTWDRLVEIKQKYDPANMFHLNQNISPKG